MKQSRTILISVLIAGLALGGVIATIFYGDNIRVAFKTTDPLDPDFDPMDFDFRDYPGDEKYRAVAQMFPIGTDRAYVQQVMDASNATLKSKSRKEHSDSDHYAYQLKGYPGFSYHYYFRFDEADKLVEIAILPNRSRVISSIRKSGN